MYPAGGSGFPHLVSVLQAIVFFAPLAFLPGYAAAWLTNIFDFRTGSLARRIAVAIPLSISTAPISIQLLWRYCSIHAVFWLYAILTAVVLGTISIEFLRKNRSIFASKSLTTPVLAIGALSIAGWLIVSLVSLLDIQIGTSEYFSVTAYDYSSRIPMASSIADTSFLPPVNPFFNPGHATALRYHYFWPMTCGLAATADAWLNPALETRDALTAGSVWAGIALLCVIGLYLRFFLNIEASKWKTYALAFALLGVTGFDILPVLAFDVFAFSHGYAPFATVEWWNEQVTGWLDAMLWVPHHTVALVCGLTAFLLLWRATESAERRSRGISILLAGAALASACGTSIYVTVIFGIFFAVWTLYLAKGKEYSRAAMFAASGAVGLLLAAPFLREILVPPGTTTGTTTGAGGAFPIAFAIRGFRPLDSLCAVLALPSWVDISLRLLFLPLNYFLELGFFYYVANIQWRKFRQGEPSRADIAATAMLLTSALASTFLRSNQIQTNDLGYRGFMLAQFVLLLWAAQLLCNFRLFSQKRQRVLIVALILGAMSTTYDLVSLRGFTPYVDARPWLKQSLVTGDGQLGARTRALELGYSWIRQNTDRAGLVQPNPARFPNYEFGLYADRRAAVMPECRGYTGRQEECATLSQKIAPAFSISPPDDALAAACSAAPVKMIVVDDSDPVWNNDRSWIWRTRPVYANQHEKVFSCH